MLRIAGKELDPRLIVFDKDGTLIAFHTLWYVWFERIMQEIASQVSLDAETRQGFAGTLGYDLETGEWDPLGPLTIASTSEVGLLMASQLYRYKGKTWDDALSIVHRAERSARVALSQDALVKPIGDVRGTLHRLKDLGLLLALATTDNRASTEHHLKLLGIDTLFEVIVCGDDGIPLKPAPDMGLEICHYLDVSPGDAIMVGDSVADLSMARGAGYAYAIGVTSGALTHNMLAPFADMVIPNIQAIEIASPTS
jgi:phosphoglycolate phosphatase